MADSYNKKEKEKKRLKKQKAKQERREQRKLEREEAGKKSFEDMIMYVDEDGNLTPDKPDPTKKKREIKVEDIVLGVPTKSDEDDDPIRNGRVKFFNTEKGFGFIIDDITKESIFVHVNNLQEEIHENDKVVYEVEMGPKGPNAVNVKILAK